MPAPVTALRALASIARGEPIPAERMGRLMSYERERYMRDRERDRREGLAPRLAVGLAADGTAASPPHLALGSWRLARRLIVDDALVAHAAALGVRLCERALRVGAERTAQLAPATVQAAKTVLGPAVSQHPLSSPSDWERLRFELLAARPAAGTIGITTMQYDAEARLRAVEIPGVSEYFGAEAPLGVIHPLSQLRRPLPGEKGEAVDDMIRRRAGNAEVAREILAFVQEWGHIADEVGRPVTIADYVERWRVDGAEAARRVDLFHRVLPNEHDPGALWDLLWEGVEREAGEHPGARFVRLTSVLVVDTHELPGLLPYFMASLYDQATRAIGRELRAAALDDTRSAPRDARADLRRVFGLANVVLSDWVAPVLTATGSDYECELAGLMSLEPIHDEDAAGDAEDWLGQVRRRLSQGGPRQALMHAQRCLRACASLSTLDPPSSAAPLLPAVRLAAATLASAATIGVVDVVDEARRAAAVLTD